METGKNRSSILKPRKSRIPLCDVELPETVEDDIQIPNESISARRVSMRRVSFASSNFIKEFASDPEKNTIWDTTYEELLSKSDHTPSSDNFEDKVIKDNVNLNQSRIVCVNTEEENAVVLLNKPSCFTEQSLASVVQSVSVKDDIINRTLPNLSQKSNSTLSSDENKENWNCIPPGLSQKDLLLNSGISNENLSTENILSGVTSTLPIQKMRNVPYQDVMLDEGMEMSKSKIIKSKMKNEESKEITHMGVYKTGTSDENMELTGLSLKYNKSINGGNKTVLSVENMAIEPSSSESASLNSTRKSNNTVFSNECMDITEYTSNINPNKTLIGNKTTVSEQSMDFTRPLFDCNLILNDSDDAVFIEKTSNCSKDDMELTSKLSNLHKEERFLNEHKGFKKNKTILTEEGMEFTNEFPLINKITDEEVRININENKTIMHDESLEFTQYLPISNIVNVENEKLKDKPNPKRNVTEFTEQLFCNMDEGNQTFKNTNVMNALEMNKINRAGINQTNLNEECMDISCNLPNIKATDQESLSNSTLQNDNKTELNVKSMEVTQRCLNVTKTDGTNIGIRKQNFVDSTEKCNMYNDLTNTTNLSEKVMEFTHAFHLNNEGMNNQEELKKNVSENKTIMKDESLELTQSLEREKQEDESYPNRYATIPSERCLGFTRQLLYNTDDDNEALNTNAANKINKIEKNKTVLNKECMDYTHNLPNINVKHQENISDGTLQNDDEKMNLVDLFNKTSPNKANSTEGRMDSTYEFPVTIEGVGIHQVKIENKTNSTEGRMDSTHEFPVTIEGAGIHQVKIVNKTNSTEGCMDSTHEFPVTIERAGIHQVKIENNIDSNKSIMQSTSMDFSQSLPVNVIVNIEKENQFNQKQDVIKELTKQPSSKIDEGNKSFKLNVTNEQETNKKTALNEKCRKFTDNLPNIKISYQESTSIRTLQEKDKTGSSISTMSTSHSYIHVLKEDSKVNVIDSVKKSNINKDLMKSFSPLSNLLENKSPLEEGVQSNSLSLLAKGQQILNPNNTSNIETENADGTLIAEVNDQLVKHSLCFDKIILNDPTMPVEYENKQIDVYDKIIASETRNKNDLTMEDCNKFKHTETVNLHRKTLNTKPEDSHLDLSSLCSDSLMECKMDMVNKDKCLIMDSSNTLMELDKTETGRLGNVNDNILVHAVPAVDNRTTDITKEYMEFARTFSICTEYKATSTQEMKTNGDSNVNKSCDEEETSNMQGIKVTPNSGMDGIISVKKVDYSIQLEKGDQDPMVIKEKNEYKQEKTDVEAELSDSDDELKLLLRGSRQSLLHFGPEESNIEENRNSSIHVISSKNSSLENILRKSVELKQNMLDSENELITITPSKCEQDSIELEQDEKMMLEENITHQLIKFKNEGREDKIERDFSKILIPRVIITDLSTELNKSEAKNDMCKHFVTPIDATNGSANTSNLYKVDNFLNHVTQDEKIEMIEKSQTENEIVHLSSSSIDGELKQKKFDSPTPMDVSFSNEPNISVNNEHLIADNEYEHLKEIKTPKSVHTIKYSAYSPFADDTQHLINCTLTHKPVISDFSKFMAGDMNISVLSSKYMPLSGFESNVFPVSLDNTRHNLTHHEHSQHEKDNSNVKETSFKNVNILKRKSLDDQETELCSKKPMLEDLTFKTPIVGHSLNISQENLTLSDSLAPDGDSFISNSPKKVIQSTTETSVEIGSLMSGLEESLPKPSDNYNHIWQSYFENFSVRNKQLKAFEERMKFNGERIKKNACEIKRLYRNLIDNCKHVYKPSNFDEIESYSISDVDNASDMSREDKSELLHIGSVNSSTADEKVLSLQEKIETMHKRSRSYWNILKITEDRCEFETLYKTIQLHVYMDRETEVVNKVDVFCRISENCKRESLFVHNIFKERLRQHNIKAAIGERYDVLTLLEYIYMNMQKILTLLDEFDRYYKLYGLEMDKEFRVGFKIVTLLLKSTWCITVDLSDMDTITKDSVQVFAKVGNVKEDSIKQLVGNCPRGLAFLSSFIQQILLYVDFEIKRRNLPKRKNVQII